MSSAAAGPSKRSAYVNLNRVRFGRIGSVVGHRLSRNEKEGSVAKRQTISRRLPGVVVEYDSRGKRVCKKFSDAYAARRFYVRKLNEGRNPHVQGDQK